MQSTANYLWILDDILGQGATACVYKGRNKKTGDLVAVKVFNNVSFMRPYEVQMREFEMLRKLNHKNIVKLFAVEEAANTKQKVLVMEYCAGGSLLNVLEEPENAFGLSESEFLIVLESVVAGMNHLRENGIVHRDIKPGNIMRLVGEEGQSIYKLTDFGAARELDDDEKFISLYGTEEYLHPDMYERAVLRKPQQKTYGVTVDLWSIGVTFYHAATGNLPFIPYGGPRRNKEVMYKITTEKPSGAITGVQKRENGPIDWSFELPITCQLSGGLKAQLASILANILEADQQKCWGFDQFFAATSDILHRMVIHVFSLQQATTHKIYINSYNTTNMFLEDVSKQTKIPPKQQEFLYEGHLYALQLNLQAQCFPKTSENKPLFLISTEHENPAGVIYRDPDFSIFPQKYDVVADCNLAKNVVSTVYQTLRITLAFLKCQELILQGLYWMIEILKGDHTEMGQRINALFQKLSFCRSVEGKVQTLYESAFDRSIVLPELKEIADLRRRLQKIQEALTSLASNILEIQEKLDQLPTAWTDHIEILQKDRSIQQIRFLLDKAQSIHEQFKKDRLTLRLAYNEEQIHKFDKINLGHYAKKVLSLFHDDCVQKYKAVLAAHSNWMRTVCDVRKELGLISEETVAKFQELEGCQDYVSKVLEKVPQRIQQKQQNVVQPSPSAELVDHTSGEMIRRLAQLKEELVAVAHELQQNNSILER
uniref:Inhibitor of nuclear factor kappa B kinase subunit epsilon n=1 Tax=Latimeria chalumnae TaxID=7897 RepID=H3ARH4_LATCH